MNILFANFSPLTIDVGSPEREPLGGTESCACYLARQLAAQGHGVTLAARLPAGTPERLLGVRHVAALALDDPGFWRSGAFDAAIAVANPAIAPLVKARDPAVVTIAWTHAHPDGETRAALKAAAGAIDCAVFVSQGQRAGFGFSGPGHVIGNAIAPAFENMFGSAAQLRAAKQNRAAYTSMPFRGLDVLVAAMEKTKAGLELDIYSAMRTYQKGEEHFAGLYEWAQRNPRTHYHGALAQPDLAARLKFHAYLAYPSTFPETFCIAAAEAMAAGLKVIATDLGALSETTLGFADLLPVRDGMHKQEIDTGFAALLEQNEAAFLAAPEAWSEERFAQMQEINRRYCWAARGKEWEEFLGTILAAKRKG